MLTLLTLINLIALLTILLQSVCVMNQMTPSTRHGVRLAYLFIGFGAFDSLTTLGSNSLPTVLMNVSIAYLLFIHKPKEFILKTNVNNFMVQKHG